MDMRSTKSMPCVFVVIPVFNRIRFTLTCLRQLLAQTYEPIKLIVVDGGSTDETVEVLQRDYPDATLLRGQGELWWGGAMRLGVEYALSHSRHESDAVLMMNNDTQIGPSYVETLVRVSLKENAVVRSVNVHNRNPSHILDAG